MKRPSRFLFTMWEGGGTLPPELGVASRLAAAGHEVHVLGDPTIRARADAAGYGFTAWEKSPHRRTLDPDDDVFKDWEVSNPMRMLRNALDRFIAAPARAFADETAAAIDAVRPDAVLADGMILGSMIGAQAAGLPVGVLMPNIWMVPTPGVTPVGPGFAPSRSAIGRSRDALVRKMVTAVFDRGLPPLNAARAAHGLEPLEHLWDQVLGCDRLYVLTSSHFDTAAAKVPDHAGYLGPILDDPSWAEPLELPWAETDHPLVVVGLSATFQDQVPLLRQIVAALSALPVRAVVTLGQMVEPSAVVSPSENVLVVPSAPHGPLFDAADVVVTHCGHGTTMKALASGTPLVCIPMGRDQRDNASRVVHAGAGVRVKPGASAEKIADAVRTVLASRDYASAASAMGQAIMGECASVDLVGEIERLLSLAYTSAASA